MRGRFPDVLCFDHCCGRNVDKVKHIPLRSTLRLSMETPASQSPALSITLPPSDSSSASSGSPTSETSLPTRFLTAGPSALRREDSTECGSKKLSRQKAFIDSDDFEFLQDLGISSREPAYAHRDEPASGGKMSRRKQEKLAMSISKISEDGTVEINFDGYAVPNLLGVEECEDDSCVVRTESIGKLSPLHIAILVVGTRGDVQPFVAIGKRLQEYGHRVRLATHKNFEEFVSKAGLEFYPLGGDPKVLADYMVKNKGYFPSRLSEVSVQKEQLKSIIESLWPACTYHGEGSEPFKVQAMIANPPAYGHVDVAERLRVPVHIIFTMPWTPTSEFPHPLSRVVRQLNANWVSYRVVDTLIWTGIGNMINKFRKKKLQLPAIHSSRGSLSTISKLPTAYIWSPHLVPKPKDWGPKVDVVGFCFLNLTHEYKPPTNLTEWLDAGSAPIYVGFGSLPITNADQITEIIVEALDKTSQRGIIGRGWGGIGARIQPSHSIYVIDDCPHDWLFPRCSAVVHHGGAGTTAAGLRAARPTTVIPFFGDQLFWGEQVHKRGVGPPPIPPNSLSVDKLVNAIDCMMQPKVQETAKELAAAINAEDGVEGAVTAFHKHLQSVFGDTSQNISSPTAVQIKKHTFSEQYSVFVPTCLKNHLTFQHS